MVRSFFLFALFFFPLLVGRSQNNLGFTIKDGKKKVQIPIELHNNLIVVPVVLNGMLPLKFIVDTGVRTAILTQKTFSDILNLTYSRKYSIAGPGGENIVDAYITNNVSLDLPGVSGKGHALLVLDQDMLELRNYLGSDVHGILGYEMFSRFIVAVDYEKKVLTLYAPGKFRKKRKYQKLDMEIVDTKPFIYAEVEMSSGEKLNARLLVDSGASHGLMLEPASNPVIVVPEKKVSTVIGRGIGGEILGKVGRINQLKLGSYKLEEPIANFPDPNSYIDSLKLGTTFRHGSIGGEVLSRFTTIYNFSREELYLKKNSSLKKKYYYNLSGLTIKAKGSRLNVFEVDDVRDQTEAKKADVRIGDQIISINGLKVSTLDLNIVNGLLNSKPGKRIKLEINRSGQKLKREFILVSDI